MFDLFVLRLNHVGFYFFTSIPCTPTADTAPPPPNYLFIFSFSGYPHTAAAAPSPPHPLPPPAGAVVGDGVRYMGGGGGLADGGAAGDGGGGGEGGLKLSVFVDGKAVQGLESTLCVDFNLLH